MSYYFCPNCASVMKVGLGGIYECTNNLCTSINGQLTKEELYQQRLDNILNKMEKCFDYYWVQILIGIDITYNRFDDKKILLWSILRSKNIEISLETVEHLLNNLESE